MERLWAPWRMNYIQNIPRQNGCIFCAALESDEDEKNFLVTRTPHSLVMLNTFPYNNGHLLVAPRKHTGDPDDLSIEEITDLMTLIKKMLEALKKILSPDGFNIGMNIGKSAGAGIADHLHMHIVPRWTGDTNFMSVCSDIKLISQSLREFYVQLKQCLNETN